MYGSFSQANFIGAGGGSTLVVGEAYFNILGERPVGGAGHYMGGERTKFDYMGGALPPRSPHCGKP